MNNNNNNNNNNNKNVLFIFKLDAETFKATKEQKKNV